MGRLRDRVAIVTGGGEVLVAEIDEDTGRAVADEVPGPARVITTWTGIGSSPCST